MIDYMYDNNIIIFSYDFNKLLDSDLLSKYNEIIFSNYVLSYDLLDSLINNNYYHCKFRPSIFNQPVNNLPCSITNLTFGTSFNQLVEMLPNSIIKLTFGNNFNQQVDNLPNSIISLTFGYRFNQSVDNLPCSITNLTFSRCFTKKINNLPKLLKKIECPRTYLYLEDLEDLENKNISIELL